MFKVNTESELLELLKIVSEEAVKKTKRTLSESKDPAQNSYMQSLKASEGIYGVGLTEQEDVEAEETEPTEEPEPEAETPEAEPETTMDPDSFGVSFDSVIKDINTLRAGRSTKDKDIKDQLLGYYDRLDDGERKILHLFLSELSKILQGAIDASDAQDPSDPPFNADISFPEEEGEVSPEEPAGTEPTEEPESGEDTSPPIKVNERQELNEIRKNVNAKSPSSSNFI